MTWLDDQGIRVVADARVPRGVVVLRVDGSGRPSARRFWSQGSSSGAQRPLVYGVSLMSSGSGRWGTKRWCAWWSSPMSSDGTHWTEPAARWRWYAWRRARAMGKHIGGRKAMPEQIEAFEAGGVAPSGVFWRPYG